VPKALSTIINGQADATKAANQAQKAVEEIAKNLK
jgi:ABC-type glycerol-3-phosphate transport system substrate-binding protein